MQIQSVNNSYSNTNFKSALPVFVKVGADIKSAVPAVGEKMNDKCRAKLVHMLNNSLKAGVDSERDKMGKILRDGFKEWVRDFYGRVTTFTCVDGGIRKSAVQGGKDEFLPQFYIATDETAAKLERLRKYYKDTHVSSNWNRTAEVDKANSDYYVEGKKLVQGAFKNYSPFGWGPHSMIVYFSPVKQKNGKIVDYKVIDAEFKYAEDPSDPKLFLDKLR